LAAGAPDLLVSSSPTITGGFPARGGFGRISASIKNQGTGVAGASRTKFLLRRSGVADVVLCDLATTTVNAGSTVNAQCDFMLPASTPTGAYNIVIIADDRGQVSESDEGNNIRVSTFTVNVQ
jgi:subtilase family serine protease